MAGRDMGSVLRDIVDRISGLERRIVRAAQAVDLDPLRNGQEWGMKGAPTSQVAQHVNRWFKAVDSGGSVDAKVNTDGILINEAGVYEITARQRVAGTSSAYSSLAIDGDRAALDSRLDGIFDHDHAAAADHFTQSRYVGTLPANTLITYGPPAGQAASVQYTTEVDGATFTGTLLVRRIS